MKWNEYSAFSTKFCCLNKIHNGKIHNTWIEVIEDATYIAYIWPLAWFYYCFNHCTFNTLTPTLKNEEQSKHTEKLFIFCLKMFKFILMFIILRWYFDSFLCLFALSYSLLPCQFQCVQAKCHAIQMSDDRKTLSDLKCGSERTHHRRWDCLNLIFEKEQGIQSEESTFGKCGNEHVK